MKKVVKLILILCFSALMNSCQLTSEGDNGFLNTKLNSGTPKSIEASIDYIAGEMGLSELKYTSLNTGIDTIDVYFGSFIQSENPGYWIALLHSNDLSQSIWSTVSLSENDSLPFPSNNIDLNFDNGAKRISLRLMHNPDTDEVFYAWLRDGKKSKLAHIVEIATPIRVNKAFPELEVELLSGTKLNIVDFQGKYVVINWWHSGCAPCIAALPGLNKLADKYKNRQDVEFLAIAFDSRERVERLLMNREFKFTQSLGDKESAKIFGESFPKYLILNPEGVVTYLTSRGSANSYKGIEMALTQQIGD